MKFILRAYLLTGLLLVGYGFLLSSCTAAVLPTPPAVPKKIDNLQDAETAFIANQINTYGQIWKEENNEQGDSFVTGLSAWQLANATKDSAWSSAAIDSFRAALKEDAGDIAQIKAWLGSSHALMARDFPIKGWWLIIPGPGFVRLYHVKRSIVNLHEAVNMAPKDPVIRLIRGSTYISMPSIFGVYEEGMEDFSLLEDWIADPQLNPKHAGLLASHSWLQKYFLSCARAMSSANNKKKAKYCWQQLFLATKKPILKDLAQWHLH